MTDTHSVVVASYRHLREFSGVPPPTMAASSIENDLLFPLAVCEERREKKSWSSRTSKRERERDDRTTATHTHDEN